MNIKVKIDKYFMAKAKVRQEESPIVFYMCWEHEGLSYPMDVWSDFGIVILGWWTRVIRELLEGAGTSDFVFMDGPYLIKARYNSETGMVELAPKGLDITWQVLLTDIVKELIDATDTIYRELTKMQIREKDRIRLEKYLVILRGYL